jgi:altronate hydrolase
VLEGQSSIDELGETVFQRLLALASGEPSKSEQQGFGEAEFVPWQLGAVL